MIGVTNKEFNETNRLVGDGAREWSFSGFGHIWSNGVMIKDYGNKWQEGDIISMRIYKVKGELEFYINA